MTQQPHEVIWTLTNAVVVSSGIHVVAELGVADLIGDDPVNVTELASRCGADPEALARVLRLLATTASSPMLAEPLSTPSRPGCCVAIIRSRCAPSPR